MIAMLAAFVAGFAVSAVAWPLLRRWWIGAEAEIAALREKARALEAALRARL